MGMLEMCASTNQSLDTQIVCAIWRAIMSGIGIFPDPAFVKLKTEAEKELANKPTAQQILELGNSFKAAGFKEVALVIYSATTQLALSPTNGKRSLSVAGAALTSKADLLKMANREVEAAEATALSQYLTKSK